QVSVEGLTDWLAVVPGFSDRKHLAVLIDAVRYLVQYGGTFRSAGLSPRGCSGMSGIERSLNIFCGPPGNLGKRFAIYRRNIFKILTFCGLYPASINPVFIAGLECYK